MHEGPFMLPFTRPTIGEDEINAVREVLESGWITTGERARLLEHALAGYIGGGVQVKVFNSGTSALEAAFLASGIGPGDEVIVPAMSFVATANVVLRVGAKPVFVDVADPGSRVLDAAGVEAAVTPKTRAVVPVHFAGLPVDMDPLYELAGKNDLIIIEDAAQAIGTTYKRRKIGASGNPVCFSFHPNKNMTTIEGGAVAASDGSFIERAERIRFHGIERDKNGTPNVREWGGKMNLPDVGAAIGLVQIGRLDDFNRTRRRLANRYLDRLPVHPAFVGPADRDGHSWHMFCVCIDAGALGTTRADIQKRLADDGIGTGIHYPAIHLFDLYRGYGYKEGDFPTAERIGEQTLTLPLFPGMTETDVDHVCDSLDDILSG
ncbi:MAG: DegT/DnrJ/EryC1/StrS family aminotransferase [bacterium]